MSLEFKELITSCPNCMLSPYFDMEDTMSLPHIEQMKMVRIKDANGIQYFEPVWWWWFDEYFKKNGKTSSSSLIKFGELDLFSVTGLIKRFKGFDTDYGQTWVDDVTAMSGLTKEIWIQLFNLEFKRRGKINLIVPLTWKPQSDRDGDF